MNFNSKCHAGRVHCVVAMPSEARLVVEHFHLSKISGCLPFRTFVGRNVSLVVSGVGKQKVMEATRFLIRIAHASPCDAWLNLGIAGHKQLPLETPVLAHKAIDAASGRAFFPMFVFKQMPCQTQVVKTVEKPELHYPDDCVYDMEASGFCQTLSGGALLELVHVLKIISDNKTEAVSRISRKRIWDLFAVNMPLIGYIVEALKNVSSQVHLQQTDPFELFCFAKHWHFSVTETHMLRKLLRQYQVWKPGASAFDSVKQETSGSKVLKKLSGLLEDLCHID